MPCSPLLQAALAESARLKEQLAALPLKSDLLSGIFGQERASGLLAQVAGCMQDREPLHSSLLQRKGKLQVRAAGRQGGAQATCAGPRGRCSGEALLPLGRETARKMDGHSCVPK